MSNMRIIEIPASMRENAGRKNTVRKLRVAAYCRVSTEEEEQQGSFEIQKLYYTEKINSTPEWEVAGIYADDGISGVHTKKRDGFNQMIQDCKKRKIDLILTKSISRFARNTLDSIQYVRMLKQMGIAVVFEKENINTATMNSEMILTVLSAFAQAESESISQNVARGKRMGYKHGKFAFPYGRIIGYRKGADGKPEIVPEQAEIIRLIFNSYLQGDSLQSIKTKLETAGALTARGNTEWSAQSIQRILQNEKYCGDVLLQKTFTEDVLTGVHKKNTGQLPQYYIENYHEGIVSKQIFREVQAEIARRNSKSAANQRKRRRGRYNSKYALTERLVCGDCGSPYKRVTWNIHGRKQIVWRCVNRIEYGTKFCGSSPSIPEEKLLPLGIPVRPAFARPASKEDVRRHLGLPENAPLFLVMSGSMGFGKVHLLTHELVSRLENGEQAVIICGNNKKRMRSLRLQFHKNPNVHIIGFTRHVAEYMAAADVLFTKPGGLSSTEAAVRRVPLVHTDPIPGCETKNRAFFVSHGMSVTGAHQKELAEAGISLAHDDARQIAMRDAQRKNSHPQAGTSITHLLKKLVSE